jgi:small subunit ribosomal protein S1
MSFSAEDFAKALEAHDYAFQTGSIVRGRVASHGSEGAYVDIGGKAAALVPTAEASLQKVADLETVLPLDSEREFIVIRDQDADGQVLLSVKRLELKQLWTELAEQQEAAATVTAKVNGVNKGGVTVDVGGLRGFVPRSHLSDSSDLDALRGRTLTLGFLEVAPDRNKLVMSERIAARAASLGQLEVGQLIEGKVVNLKPYGAFVEFGGVTGLLHINQISKQYVANLGDLLKIGDQIKAVIVDLDEIKNRISLSTRVLENHAGEVIQHWDTVMAEAETRLQSASEVMAERDA